MLVIGAGGFAKEVLEILHLNKMLDHLVFYDDTFKRNENAFFSKFPIIKSVIEAKDYFQKIDNQFTIAIGNPILRKQLYSIFKEIGGIYVSTISNQTSIGSYEVSIGEGCNILPGVKISNNVQIEKGCILYYNVVVTHDVRVGKFVEISPGSTLLGSSTIGDFSNIGAGAIILPNIKIGKHVIVAAGAVVTKDVSDNKMVAGVPANVKKALLPPC